MRWENVHIFISSTFNDMHAERDYLVKSVFPALSEWCEERKLRLIDIDLRWGVTAADSEAKNTVRACLRNIDECRPFFICFLGQRRGWVPGADDIGEDTYGLFPNLLEKNYVGEASVTEMEIIHALIDPLHNGILRKTKDDSRSGDPVEYAFFYLRDPDYLRKIPHPDLNAIYTNEAEPDKAKADSELTRWRDEEIPRTGRPVSAYTAEWQMNESTPEIALPLFVPTTAPKDSSSWKNAFSVWEKRWSASGVAAGGSGEITGAELDKAKEYNQRLTGGRLGNFTVDSSPLANLIIEQLKDAIAKRFPEHMNIEAQSPLQKEIDQQAQFLRIAGEGFIERAGDFDALNEYLNNNERRPFALTAFAGMGKTSLLAHFIDTHSVREGETLHYRFVGGSDDSVSSPRLIRSLLLEMNEAGKIWSAIPDNSNDMMNKLPDLLAEAGQKGKTILIIDALNQLESGMNELYWIPEALPENVKLIVSFKRGEESADEYFARQEENAAMVFHSIKPFDSEEDRRALISVYLEQYFKELDEPRIQALIGSDGAANPLFLKTILSELRVFGVHSDLTEVIQTRFGTTPVTAFTAILERMESDPAYTEVKPSDSVPHIFGWIAHSRYGLSVDELSDLLLRENLAETKAGAESAIFLILRQLRVFLAKRDGRVDFFYESLKIAATLRYTGGDSFARKAEEWHRSLAEYFETLPLTSRHRLMEQAWQFAKADLYEKYKALLFDYEFIDARLGEFGVTELISDYTYSDEKSVKLPKDCHILSEKILSTDKGQLASQLWGRMADFDLSDVKGLLNQAVKVKKERGEVWLRPKKACMPKPGGALVRILPVKRGSYPILMPGGKSVAYTDTVTDRLAIMDIESGRTLKTINAKPNRMALTNNGDSIVFLSEYYRVGYLDLQSCEVQYCDEAVPYPQKTFIAAGSIAVVRAHGNNVIHIWDVKENKYITIEGYGTGMKGVALTSDGERLVSGFDDNTVRVWDTATGECVSIFKGHEKVPTEIYLDEPRDLVYSFSFPEKLIVFRLSTGEQVFSSDVRADQAILSHDKNTIIYKTYSKLIVADALTGDVLTTIITTRQNRIDYISVSDDGKTIFTMSNDKSLMIWNAKTGEKIGELWGHSDSVLEAFMSADNRFVISVAVDNTAKIWDMEYLDARQDGPGEQGAVDTIAALAVFNERQFVVGNKNKGVTVVDAFTADPVGSIAVEAGIGGGTYAFDMFDVDHRSGKMLVGRPGFAEIFSLKSGELVSRVQKDESKDDSENDYYFFRAKLIGDGDRIIITSNTKVIVIDVNSSDVLMRFDIGEHSSFELFDNRTKMIVFGKNKSKARIWDLCTGEPLTTLNELIQEFQYAALYPDESAFLTRLYSGIYTYDINTGEEISKIEIKDNPFWIGGIPYSSYICFAGFPDFVWICGDDRVKILALLNYKTGNVAAQFFNDIDFDYKNIVFTPDGEHLACTNRGDLSFLQLENADRIRDAAELFKYAKEFYEKKEYESAVEQFELAATRFRELSDKNKTEYNLNMAAHIDIMAGLCYDNLKNPEGNLRCYLRALTAYELLVELFGEKHLPDLATTLSNLAISYEKSDKQKALEYFERCMKIREGLK